MKNIWIINHYAAPPQYETRVRNNVMAKYLERKGYNVKIFSASTIHNTNINLIEDKRKLFVEKRYDELDFVHIRTSNYTGNGISRVINMLQFPFRLLRVAKKVDQKPDVIICDLEAIFSWSPYLVAKKFKSKFILEVRDLWPESIVVHMNISKRNPIIRMLYRLEKWAYKKSDKLIFSMEGGKDYIVDKGWDKDIDMTKVYHINNGVDIEQFNYNKENYITKDDDLDNKKTFKVMYAGSVRQANHVEQIVDTAEIIMKKVNSDIQFLIYGDGSAREELEEYCLNHNINNIKFKGHLDKEYIPYILSQGQLNIIVGKDSYLYKYGLSLNKMFDYFASGKPILSNIECGYDLLEKYNCGETVKGGSSESLAEGILRFYNMPKEEYNIYCKNALKAAQDFDFKILTDKLKKVKLWQQIVVNLHLHYMMQINTLLFQE